MSAKSIQDLLEEINNANINSQGVVAWDGVNGQKAFEQNLTETLGARGILYFTSTEQMASAGGSDSGYAVAPDTNGGMNIYRFFPNIVSGIEGAVTSTSAGQWRPIFAVPAPVDGVWTFNGSDDIIPNTGYIESGVAIGKNTVTDGIALEIRGSAWGDGKGRAILIPVLSTAQMNAMTLVNNGLIVGSGDKMLMRYDSTDSNYKSAGVFSQSVAGTITASATSYTIIFAINPHVDSYKVFIEATNDRMAAILAGGYYITKTGSQFTINFLVAAATSGAISFDYQMSH